MNLELNFLSTCILEISNLSIILLGIRKASPKNIAWETSPQKTKQFLHYGLIKHSGILPHMATNGPTLPHGSTKSTEMESYNMEYLKNLYFHEDPGCL